MGFRRRYLGRRVDKNDVAWRAEQLLNGQPVICFYTNHFVVSIPKLIVNFEANMRSQPDLEERLLMALTQDRAQGYPAARPEQSRWRSSLRDC